jgi:hypothetical protein
MGGEHNNFHHQESMTLGAVESLVQKVRNSLAWKIFEVSFV